MTLFRTIDDLIAWRQNLSAGTKVGFVPTMGALHEGHLSLVKRSCDECSVTAVSIFVNPAQFGPAEDLSRYPRNLEADLALLSGLDVDCVFFPDEATVYPPEHRTWVEVSELSDVLCGASRPGHFRGVSTIVLKLVNLIRPDFMYMGLKDYQQVVILRRMLSDLFCPTTIIPCEIVRESDGLALSSRNRYLSPEERERALCIVNALLAARIDVARGNTDCSSLIEKTMGAILSSGGRIDYVSIVDSETLEDIHEVVDGARMMIAVYIGKTRLIDNMALRA